MRIREMRKLGKFLADQLGLTTVHKRVNSISCELALLRHELAMARLVTKEPRRKDLSSGLADRLYSRGLPGLLALTSAKKARRRSSRKV